MSDTLIVLNTPAKFPFKLPGCSLISSAEYLSNADWASKRNCRIINLCRSFRYQTTGYYVSLLAEARGHKPVPRVEIIEDLRSTSLIKLRSSELDQLIQKSLSHLQSEEFTLSIYFSKNMAKRYDRLSEEIFNLFPAPLLRAVFKCDGKNWELHNINAIGFAEVPDSHYPHFETFAHEYLSSPTRSRRKTRPPRYFMGILVDPDEVNPPSNARALKRFEKSADQLDIEVDMITKSDYGKIGEYDALFIRTTTAVNNYTYRFSRKAEAEGLVVIDDTQSIVRCTNKVYLAELLDRYQIPQPRTMIVHKNNIRTVLALLGYPCVLKQPDSSFSQGVTKVNSPEEFLTQTEALLDKSDLLIAQEFLPTEFDWRIGVIDRQPLYACKYYMARGHWQIYNHSEKGDDRTGNAISYPLSEVPSFVIKTAMKACNLIGNGLYGVDIKQKGNKCCVIEVNDNPSIDGGVEDTTIKDILYDTLMNTFLKRMDTQRLK